MYTDTGSAGVSTLVQRARVAGFAIYATIAIFALTLVGELLEVAGLIDLAAPEGDPLALSYTVVLVANFVIFIGSVVAVSMWIHRAHANLHESGMVVLNFTPGWAVGWYFIPIANLFKPFQAMRELWTESHQIRDSFGAQLPGMLGTWWACWIVGNILGNVSTRLSLMGDGSNFQVAAAIGAASTVSLIAAAWFLLQIIREITAAQHDGALVAKVFE